MISYSIYEMLFYFLQYAFFGWVADVAYHSIVSRRFVNRGLLGLPLQIPYGFSFVIFLALFPYLGRNYLLQFIAAAIVIGVMEVLGGTFARLASRISLWEREAGFDGTKKYLLELAGKAALTMLVYHVAHPFLLALVSLLPEMALVVLDCAGLLLIAADFVMTLLALRSRKLPDGERAARNWTRRLGERISNHTWKRLERAYPGISRGEEETPPVGTAAQGDGKIVFARGLCFDKLCWIFFVLAFFGDITEVIFCGIVSGHWMSRSSVLYGPFSLVWGIGAVVLTLALYPLRKKPVPLVFASGFLIGGVYEYLCSVFTELVFGKVFWDYSKMPLNIGGRTNVLFCVFWGLLSVAWVRFLYPRLSGLIEKIPPVVGKTLTWGLIFFMVCNGLLTMAAFARYNTRATRPQPSGAVEAFLDSQYDDAYIEHRWPNMREAQQ